jgi:hypothetical protein
VGCTALAIGEYPLKSILELEAGEAIRMGATDAVLPLDVVRARLTSVWLIGAGVVVSLVFAQTIFGGLGPSTQAVWEWLLPTIMPTVGTIISTIVATALLPPSSDSEVKRSFSVLAEMLSIFYLLLILLLVLLKGAISVDTPSWLNRLHEANLLLGPLQGVIATTLGVVFLSKNQRVKGRGAANTNEE